MFVWVGFIGQKQKCELFVFCCVHIFSISFPTRTNSCLTCCSETIGTSSCLFQHQPFCAYMSLCSLVSIFRRKIFGMESHMIMYRIFSLYTASLLSGLLVGSQLSISISFVQIRWLFLLLKMQKLS